MTSTNPQDISKSIQDTLQQMSGQTSQGMDAFIPIF